MTQHTFPPIPDSPYIAYLEAQLDRARTENRRLRAELEAAKGRLVIR